MNRLEIDNGLKSDVLLERRWFTASVCLTLGVEAMDKEAIALEVWKTTIEVQKHFNEIGIKIRSIAVTVLGGFLAVAGYAFKENNDALAGVIILASLVCWYSFYLMDRLWYHRLLRAAVDHAEQIEKDQQGVIPNIGLTTRIKADSHLLGKSAGERLTFFYFTIGGIMAVTAIVLLKEGLGEPRLPLH